ncbi:S-adenosyl-L-methionine-dependent methyltransferase [Polychytrium aggregatum]|uniref:S-adenosyl-L-methionine-dependent methyltransferase n=1 Tax=Polychytrium aggregatum TaxID=110093 RepID=UPI0022FEBC13|nr:S-adenosyl-L-methionine-dependent methyltransferase [Polychytrium aggregatum]KAI9203746.1 S-adenosyl-L-methionine-dependent methyltransferase [Polychytrium aggregatum]
MYRNFGALSRRARIPSSALGALLRQRPAGMGARYSTAPASTTTDTSGTATNTVNQDEIRKFVQASEEWWQPHGQFEMLHKMNPTRMKYIREQVHKIAAESPEAIHLASHDLARPFAGLRILDIGCGGGLLSEALARLGGVVVGADAGYENIQIAKLHSQKDPWIASQPVGEPGSIDFRHTTAEKLAEQGEQFDMVCGLEIIEHVENPSAFVKLCSQLTKPHGLLFFSTINRTPTSYLFTILLAEHLLRWVPPGTHHHHKYITPTEISDALVQSGCVVKDMTGISYDIVSGKWNLLDNSFGDLEMNYIVAAQKQG